MSQSPPNLENDLELSNEIDDFLENNPFDLQNDILENQENVFQENSSEDENSIAFEEEDSLIMEESLNDDTSLNDFCPNVFDDTDIENIENMVSAPGTFNPTYYCDNCSLRVSGFFCKTCENIKLLCSECHEIHKSISIFSSHLVTTDFQEIHKSELRCYNCSEVATKKCLTCIETYRWLCDECSNLHAQLKAFINHIIIPVETTILQPELQDPYEALIKGARSIAHEYGLKKSGVDRLPALITSKFYTEFMNKQHFSVTKKQLLSIIATIIGNANSSAKIAAEIDDSKANRNKTEKIDEKSLDSPEVTKKGKRKSENISGSVRDNGFERKFKDPSITLEFKEFFLDVLELRFGNNKLRQTLQEYNRLANIFDNPNVKGPKVSGISNYIEKCLSHVRDDKMIYLKTLMYDPWNPWCPYLQCSFSFIRYFNPDDEKRDLYSHVYGVLCPFESFKHYYHFIYPGTLKRADEDAADVLGEYPHEIIRRYRKDTFPYSMNDKILYFINYPRAMGNPVASGPRVFALQRIPDPLDDNYEFRYVYYVHDNTMTYKFYNSGCNIKFSVNIFYGKDLSGDYRAVVGTDEAGDEFFVL